MPATADNILEVRNLSVSFTTGRTSVNAVDCISFSLPKGKTMGIVGESGSGKSVTSLAIMRLIPCPPGLITGGEIHFRREGAAIDLTQLPEKSMCAYRGREIAMIFQEPMTSLNPVYTCGRQVSEAVKLHLKLSSSQAKVQTLDWFNEVKLPRPEAIYSSYPHQLSGGQKQRVMIAMAMCCHPSVLIADEPTTALDVTIQMTILELMRSLQAKYGMSILFITHDLGVVAEIADTVQVMYKGKIVEQGPVETIFRSPKHPYTLGLLACRPQLDKRLLRLPVVADFTQNEEPGESMNSLNDVFGELSISPEERKIAHRRIYGQAPVLKIENLRTWYPEKRSVFGGQRSYVKALDDVSFEVYPGETLGLVGESGCGKTTLGRSILRLIEPTAGRIFFDGKDLAQIRKKELRSLRRQMQIIFQDPYSSLNPRMNIGDAVMEPLRAHVKGKNDKERRSKVITLLERVGLGESQMHRYPHEFSGGQRQRICIARALVLEPRFIICDESVSALDVSVQAQVLNLLNELKREFDFTYIFISHDLSVVKFMSDRMIVMHNGRIVEIGEADALYRDPGSEYTRQLIDAIPKGIGE